MGGAFAPCQSWAAFILFILIFRGGLYVQAMYQTRFYARRTAGRDCDHRRVDCFVVAGGAASPRGGTAQPMHEQGQAIGPGLAKRPRRCQEVSGHVQPKHHDRCGQRLLSRHPGSAAGTGTQLLRPATRRRPVVAAGYSWIVKALPYMDEANLYNSISHASAKFTADAFTPYTTQHQRASPCRTRVAEPRR